MSLFSDFKSSCFVEYQRQLWGEGGEKDIQVKQWRKNTSLGK